MKQIRKIVLTFFVLSLAMISSAAVAQAAPQVPKSRTHYLQPTTFRPDGGVYHYLTVTGMKGSQKIKSLKSTNSRVVRIPRTDIMGSTFSYSVEKPGTATISFKISGKTYKMEIHVKKYTNPAKSITIAGIKNKGKSNLASLADKATYTQKIKLAKTIKNCQIKVVAKKGWKIQEISLFSNKTQVGDTVGVKYLKKPVSTGLLKDTAIRKNVGGNRLQIYFVNTKNKETIMLTYNIDMTYKDSIRLY